MGIGSPISGSLTETSDADSNAGTARAEVALAVLAKTINTTSAAKMRVIRMSLAS
jgi:hypothetical protein